MEIGEIVFSRQGSAWLVLSLPNDNGWLMAKKVQDGLIFEIHVSNFIVF